MNSIDLGPIKKLYHLWKPIYPYLIKQIKELTARGEGNVLEIGPFCGTIFSLQADGFGSSFWVAAFPAGIGDFFREEAVQMKVGDAVRVVESDSALAGIEDNSIDLAIFRGALFFPSLFRVNFSAIHRVLGVGGVAIIGGGFGKYTPQSVIGTIAKRSRELNLQAGKVEISEREIQESIGSAIDQENIEIISEGGLWVVMRK